MINRAPIQSLRIRNLLSFGEDAPEVRLEPLNVLIGPNGSGKTNLVEIIKLLKSTPVDLADALRAGGGIVEWLWKKPFPLGIFGVDSRALESALFGPGKLLTPDKNTSKGTRGSRLPSRGRGARSGPTATIEVLANPPSVEGSIRYRLSLGAVSYQLDVRDERIEGEPRSGRQEEPQLFFGYINGRPMLKMNSSRRELPREQVNPQQSILAQRKDPSQYPELTHLGEMFAAIKVYQNWEFGSDSRVRDLWGAELRTDFLDDEDMSNLGLMLNRLNADPQTKPKLLEYLRLFYDGAEGVETAIQTGGLVDVRLLEAGGVSIPAIRLSDGTLRWLALLTILLHPSPPPLVCIEEPELGLHPDIIPTLAQLLKRASERMQLIVTTHSSALVDELSDMPETVIVCEKERGSTVLRRLDRLELSEWLKEYSLGHLWRKGEIGGNRW
jgi:predicted ATPase